MDEPINMVPFGPWKGWDFPLEGGMTVRQPDENGDVREYSTPGEQHPIDWQPDPEHAQYDGDLALQVWDGVGWWEARAKWDGCVDLIRYHNAPRGAPDWVHGADGPMVDTLHLCDLDDHIAALQALREQARLRFGSDWG